MSSPAYAFERVLLMCVTGTSTVRMTTLGGQELTFASSFILPGLRIVGPGRPLAWQWLNACVGAPQSKTELCCATIPRCCFYCCCSSLQASGWVMFRNPRTPRISPPCICLLCAGVSFFMSATCVVVRRCIFIFPMIPAPSASGDLPLGALTEVRLWDGLAT